MTFTRVPEDWQLEEMDNGLEPEVKGVKVLMRWTLT